LISWRTNRVIAAKEPISYLRERIKGAELGEKDVRDRLRTHLVPYDDLAVGWSNVAKTVRGDAIRIDYERFMESRAQLFVGPIVELCSGRTPVSEWTV
jgi:hypothetical protein